MLHLDTVTRSTLALLKTLQGMPELRRTRLVGGTALALQLGHRLSDWFCPYLSSTRRRWAIEVKSARQFCPKRYRILALIRTNFHSA